MSDALQEHVSILCEEVGLPAAAPDARGVYHIEIEGLEVRVSTLNNGRVILLGVIGRADAVAERRQESRQTLMMGCLALQAVRFGKLGTSEVLTLEPETDELVLWRSFDGPGMSVPAFLAGAEALLNELEFWKTWLSPR
ncbi:MAG TPA: type III secretion system chaperone [Prosthecobacter sp.]